MDEIKKLERKLKAIDAQAHPEVASKIEEQIRNMVQGLADVTIDSFEIESIEDAILTIYRLAVKDVRLRLDGDNLKVTRPQDYSMAFFGPLIKQNKELLKAALRRIYHERWVEPCFLEPPMAWPSGAWPVTMYQGKNPVMFFDLDQLVRTVKNPAVSPTQAELLTAPASGRSYYSG